MVTKNIEKILSSKSAWRFLLELTQAKILSHFTRGALPVFVRGGDVISTGPLLFGTHEPHVTAAIKHFAESGNDQFLIDVGANIGLTSSQCGNYFESVYAYEPSPLCHGVLETNLLITLVDTPYSVMKYGLGRNNEAMKLRVPRHNWGGAHVISDDNSYSQELLIKKDGFTNYDPKNYLTVGIEIKSATEVFANLFAHLVSENKSKGVIKIDVEGLEPIILDAIAKTVPNDFELCIVFEYLNQNESFEMIMESYKYRGELYCLAKFPNTNGNYMVKLISLFAAGKQSFTLKKWGSNLFASDFVLFVNCLK